MSHTINHEEVEEYRYSNVKLWNPKGFIFIGVIFSFLPAAILYALNYGRLGYKKERLYNLLGFIALFIVGAVVSVYIQVGFMKAVFYGLNIGLSVYMRTQQEELFQRHIEAGGKKASYLLPVIIGLIFMGLIIWAMIYSINIPDNSIKIHDDELFYTERIDRAEVEEIGGFLESIGLFGNDEVVINAGIDRNEKEYIFSLIVIDEAINDSELAEYMKEIGTLMSQEVLNNRPVKINLCNERFEVIKEIQ